MTQLKMHSLHIGMGFLVLTFHAFILFLMIFGGHDTVDKRSNLVLVREIIELESADVSKAVDRRSTSDKSITKGGTKINPYSPEGYGQINPVQDYKVASAPISMPSADSAALSNPKPPYPITSRENGEQGRVYLNACVSERGKIDRLDLAKSSGFHALDRSALNTVRHWEFIPAYESGKPISMCYRLPIHFVLSSHLNIPIESDG
ncbi:energy transducer TonB [Polynucleobacter sp. CS-Odin-A6]|uniref:energy transducer TonB n=1 Tax=Polynucleobacter sp. CS-Odin-A6 TaxID=2689106 RepID=UPI001C0DED4F|nr:energy transducer TonB [Polynucleobacter sp. CS-Odin-A6]MBU3621545.1 energy transducer TonB [Polynucleobacter sp. CS-Odin-A6]